MTQKSNPSKVDKLILMTEGMGVKETFLWLKECLVLYKFNLSNLIEREYSAFEDLNRKSTIPAQSEEDDNPYNLYIGSD